MANNHLWASQIIQIIRLHTENRSYRLISEWLGISRKTVTKYVLLFKATGLSYEEIRTMDESVFWKLFTNQEVATVKTEHNLDPFESIN